MGKKHECVLHEVYVGTLPCHFAGLGKGKFQWDFCNCYYLVVKPERSYEPTSLEEQVTRGFFFFQLLG